MAMTNVYTGATGTLQLQPDNVTSATEGADADLLLKSYAIQPVVGRVTGVEVHVNTDLQGYYEIGRRHPVSLHSENIHISGKVSRAYVNGALVFLLLGRGANPIHIDERPATGPAGYPQPGLLMTVILQDPAVPSTRVKLVLTGVKFENWAFSLPQDDIVMENVTFKALTVEVHDDDATPPASAGDTNELKPAFKDLPTHG
jgi:hypothetical protein